MKRIFCYFFLFLFCGSVFAQTKIDSLSLKLEEANDHEKAYLYFQLAKEVYYKDILKLIDYSQKADSFANIHGLDSIRVNALNNLSYAAIHTGKVQQAIEYNTQAIALANEKKLLKESISSQFFKGYYYYATGKTDSSLYFLELTRQKAVDANESKIELQCLNTMAANYLSQGKYNLALVNFTSAYQIADRLQLKQMLPNLSLNIGTTLLYNEDLDRAIEYFEQVISNSDSTDVTIAYATALNNLGACYSRMANHEKALVYFNKALPAYKKLNNRLQIAQTYSNMGQSSYFLGYIEVATTYLDEAIQLNRAGESTNHLIVNLILLGRLQTMKDEFIQAKMSLNEAQELIEKFNINYNQGDLFKTFSYYYSQTGEYEEALDYKQQELNYRDSTFNESRQTQISKLETEFETKLKENENESLRKDLDFQNLQMAKQHQIRNFLVILTFLIIVLVLILLNRARIKKKTHRIIEQQRTELELANKTKDKFFSIIAHDLKSPFGTIIGFSDILSEFYDELTDDERRMYTNDLNSVSHNTYRMLEELLTWARIQQGGIKIKREQIALVGMVKSCLSYYEATAKLKHITITNSVDPEALAWGDRFSLETVISNLLNNAIKFTSDGGSISISSEKKAGQFILSIADSGVGMNPEIVDQLFRIDKNVTTPGTNSEEGTGLGLILCKEFVEMNGGEIWVSSEKDKGSIFSFSLTTSSNL